LDIFYLVVELMEREIEFGKASSKIDEIFLVHEHADMEDKI